MELAQFGGRGGFMGSTNQVAQVRFRGRDM